jgi:hypothetical protein
MSVMICNRGDCENIMCHLHSEEFGYICRECLDELIQRGVDTDITAFMNSPVTRGKHAREPVDPRKHFGKIFRDTDVSTDDEDDS